MDELIVNQTKYISSKRAAALTGYARDYIGQLIRQGKLDAQRVGRAWYVSEVSIKTHAGIAVPATAAVAPTSLARVNRFPVVPGTIEYALPKTWSEIRYLTDDAPLFPISDNRVALFTSEIANKINAPANVDQAERVKITVIRPRQHVITSRASVPGGLMGVRMPHVRAQAPAVLRRKRAIRMPSADLLGVMTGALAFLVLLPLF